MTFMSTVRSMGEASRKLSSCEAWNPCRVVVPDNWNVVRFGKTKWPNHGDLPECKWDSFRLVALLKRGREGGITGS
jgi:hypothetical protein